MEHQPGSTMSSPDMSLLPTHLERQSLHHGARILGERPLGVSTPASQWAYALSYAPRVEVAVDGVVVSSVRFIFDLSVMRGQIGVGWTNSDGTAFISEQFATSASGRVTLPLRAGERVGRLVFRNVDASGEPSAFLINDARAEPIVHQYPVSIVARGLAEEVPPRDGGTLTVFDTDAARAINAARLGWLEESDLPVERARVLDAGSGVGHFVSFYLDRGCSVVAVDGREENILELRRRYPVIDAHVEDVQTIPARRYGVFDVIHCFGLLYHLDSPVLALRHFNAMCRGMLILETMVCDSSRPVAVLADETKAASQAMEGLGCRPSPSFVTLALNRAGFQHVYAAAVPPRHEDFQFAWQDNLDTVRDGHPLRCVFVASRERLVQPSLVPLLES
jgi:SAM-dependent methyltransferase